MHSLSKLVESFLNTFQTITKFFRKVFKYLHWYAKRYRNVFPSVETISKAVGCSPRTVKSATAFFAREGWVYKRKIPYCSNLYFLNEEIIRLEIGSNDTFKLPNLPVSCPVLESSSFSKEGTCAIFRNIEGLSKYEMRLLSKKFREFQLAQALDDAKWYQSKGKKIRNMMGYLWSRAKNAIG